jgi:aspartate aminotransferase
MPGVMVRKPEGAFYMCAKLPLDDSNGFAEFLLTDFALDGETVMLAPADGFYATPGLGRDEVRIAYVLESATIRESVEILAGALSDYRGKSNSEH